MVLRHVTVELTEKQYETLCRMTAVEQLETSWSLIQEIYASYAKENQAALPLLGELQLLKEWRLNGK